MTSPLAEATAVAAAITIATEPSSDESQLTTSQNQTTSSFTSVDQSFLPNDTKAIPEASDTDSEYRWILSKVDEKEIWYRKMDGMAAFILHWQHRFHNHGDCYGFGLLWQQDSNAATPNDPMIPSPIKITHVREALRRMRSIHPVICIELVPRKAVNAPAVTLPATLRHLDLLQVCLAYRVPQSEKDIEQWLDDSIIIHNADEDPRDHRTFFREQSLTERPSCSGMKFHFWEGNQEQGRPTSIIIEQSHVLTDGVGVQLIYDEMTSFLALTLADPTTSPIAWGPEVSRLPPSLQDAIAEQPETWKVSKEELKQVERETRSNLSGKARAPNLADKIADTLLETTLSAYASDSNFIRTINRPLAKIVQKVAQKGETFPLGLLPTATKPFNGPYTCSDFLDEQLSREDTAKFLAGLKRRGVTMGPFVEAAMAFATTWVRRHRGLTPAPDRWDSKSKVIGSFSNAVSKRGELLPQHQRYLGLAMGGFPTKIMATEAIWSSESLQNSVPSPDNGVDRIPNKVNVIDMESIIRVTKKLGEQYRAGRTDPQWLKHSQATLFGSMQAEYLLMSNEAYYPSHPWLSSVGNLNLLFKPTRPIPDSPPPFSPADFDSSEPTINKLGSGRYVLRASGARGIGRQNIAQPICHTFTFDGELTIQVSFPDWLYNTTNNGRKVKKNAAEYAQRGSILPYWFRILRLIVQAVIDENGSEVHQRAEGRTPSRL